MFLLTRHCCRCQVLALLQSSALRSQSSSSLDGFGLPCSHPCMLLSQDMMSWSLLITATIIWHNTFDPAFSLCQDTSSYRGIHANPIWRAPLLFWSSLSKSITPCWCATTSKIILDLHPVGRNPNDTQIILTCQMGACDISKVRSACFQTSAYL